MSASTSICGKAAATCATVGGSVGRGPVGCIARAIRQRGQSPPGAEESQRRWWGRHISEFRWTAELATLTLDPAFYGLGVPHGNGQPVLLIPGFLAADTSLSVMGGWLFRLGYKPRFSGIMLANVDCSDRAVDRLEKRLDRDLSHWLG